MSLRLERYFYLYSIKIRIKTRRTCRGNLCFYTFYLHSIRIRIIFYVTENWERLSRDKLEDDL